MSYRIQIKGMVCQRCIMLVKNELDAIGAPIDRIMLGEVYLHRSETELLSEISDRLQVLGLQLLEDKQATIVKSVEELVALFYNGSYDFPYNFRFAKEIEKNIGVSYDKISSLYLSSTGTTIEQYIIQYRIDRVKDLLACTQETLSNIAYLLGYSSVAHVSSQFKLITGVTPSDYRMSIAQEAKML